MPTTDFLLTVDPQPDRTYVTLVDVNTSRLHAEDYGKKLEINKLPAVEKATLGKTLAKSALPPKVAEALGYQISRAHVRLWLDVAPGEGRTAPWEFLFDSHTGGYVACNPLVYFIRGRPGPLLSLGRDEDLTVLLASANPGSAQFPPLAYLEKEVQSIDRVLQKELPRFNVHTLRHARRDTLLHDIAELRPHVLHIVAHGVAAGECGALALESGPGKHEFLYGDDLAAAVQKAGTRLVFLSSCSTAGAAATVGHAIGELGGATVIGMQYRIRDTTALLFARAVYDSLARGESVAEAVKMGRAAIHGCGHEAGIPVLIAGGATPPATDEEAQPERLNYPPDPRPFVGRQSERHALWAILRHPEARMATVFGMGGMGKTRIAKKVGEDLQHDYRDGVRLVECDVLQGRDELIGAIANATGLSSAKTPTDLARQLKERQMLLILDCFEKIVQHADVLDQIVRYTPGVKLLVTSRIILESESEHPYELKELTKGKISERLELFEGAARQARPGFVIDAQNRKTAEALVDLLQGVPLALLLAAGRLRHLTLEELHARLQERLLDELRRPGNKNDRHASIRIVIQDSFDLLSEREKNLAMQLSVFAGGFTMKDAKAVITDDPDVEEGIARLYDQSLLSSVEETKERRYRELDTIREYMGEAGPELRELKLQHAAYYAERAQAIRKMFDQGQLTEAAEHLWLDIGNFRAALRAAKLTKNNDLLATLARALARSFLEAGIQADFQAMAKVAEEVARLENDVDLLIEIKGLQGSQARRQGDHQKAEKLWLERAALCRETGNVAKEGDSYFDIADMSLTIGNLEKVREMLDLAKRLDQTKLNPADVIGSNLIEARLAIASKDIERAMQAAAEAAKAVLALQESPPGKLYIWSGLGRVYRDAGRHDEAQKWFARMVVESLNRGYVHYAIVALLNLSESLLSQGDISASGDILQPVRALTKTSAKHLKARCAQQLAALTQAGWQPPRNMHLAKNWEQQLIEQLENRYC